MKENKLFKAANHQRQLLRRGDAERREKDANTPTIAVIFVFPSLLFRGVLYGLLYGVV